MYATHTRKMENVDVQELYNCLETNSEESQNVDSAAEEDRLKKAEDLLDDLITSLDEDKSTKKSDSARPAQKESKDIEQGVGNPSKSAKSECINVNSDVSEVKPSSSGNDSSKSPFQLNDNMKKGLSLLAYPGKGSRPNSKPRNKGVQQPRTKTKCRITIGETIEKVQDIKNSIEEQKKKSETASVAGLRVSQKDSGENEMEGPSVSSSSAENSDVSLQSASVEPKSKLGEKENWTGQSPDVQQRPAALVLPTSKAGKPEERIPLATKARAPPTRFKLSPQMGELLRFTFAHEHFPTSVHMARLAKMMGVQWSQVRNWFTNRRVENKRAGIFPRDKVLTECPYCDVTLKTEAEQKGHLFATHHVKSILGAEFVGDQEPIKWKKFPTSINAINKLSGARVLAIGYSADSEHDSQETLSETLESSTHTPDTLLQTLGSDAEKAKSKKLRKTWQVSMGLQKDDQNSTEGKCSSAVENQEGSQPCHSENVAKKRSESVVYLKMESGEEKAITTKEREIPVEGSLRVKSDKLLLSSSVSFAPLISVPPPVHPGDPCTSKTNINQESEHAQVPEAIKEENAIETTESHPSTSKNFQIIEKHQGVAKVCQIRANKEAQLLKSPKPPLVKSEDNQLPISQKTLQDTDQVHPSAAEIQKTFSQKSKTNDILLVPNSSVVASVNRIQSAHPVKENAVMKVPEECRISNTSTAGLVSVATTNPRVYTEPKESLQNFQNYSLNKVDSVRHRFQDNVGDEYMNIGYQCPTCSKVFVTEWQMMKHSLSHFKFQCDICEQAFTSQGDLKQHLYEHLTNTYEDEKYYMQFSCKTCHSLKCDCFEPLYFKAEEMLRTYTRPQKARRSSKVFLSKPNSGPNDHLRVTLGTYRKRLQKMHPSMSKSATSQVNPESQRVLLRNLNHPLQKNKFGYNSVENTAEANCSKLQGNSHNFDNSRNMPYENINSNQRDIPRLSVRNDLLTPTEESTSDAQILSQALEKPKPERRGRGKRTTKLSSNNFIYKDTDFYFMCEMCDASFLSKAELSEHMFFHRLKSRSRRAGKKRLAESEQEEETEAKKFKEEEPLATEEVETINVGGFERFKCPNCKGHFASITDLNRHRTQAHKSNESVTSTPECISVPCIMLQCYFCNRFYRRERELRRHLKHDCAAAPEDLKNKLSVGVSLTSLQEMGGGPYFVKTERNTVESMSPDLNSKLSSHRGPITCKYCFMVTRREAEMKRHVWKYCPKIPKSVIKIFKEGASLEELGFVYGEVTVEPVSSQTLNNKSQVLPTAESMDVDIETDAANSSANSSPTKAPQTPAVPVINPMPLATNSRSKGPLICTYCGIWYFREISLLKHMKERCIRISQEDKNLLHLGTGLCTFTPDTPLDTCGPSEKQGIYKIVDRSKVPVAPIKTESETPVVVPGPQQTDSIALPAVKEEPEESSAQGGVTPTKQGVTFTKGVTPTKQGLTPPNQGVTPTKHGEFQAQVSSPECSPIMKGPGRKSTRCRRCHESFSSQDAIMAHSSVHHGPKKGFYKCKLCQTKFVKYKHLREHVWEHTNETPYKCHLCATKFRTSDSIMDHLYTEHKFTQINEKNLYKWLPGRTGKYREIKEVTKNTDYEETLTDMDASLDNLAEVMVVTDQDIWKGKSNEKSPLKTIEDKKHKSPTTSQSAKTSPIFQISDMAGKPGIQVTTIAGSNSLNHKKADPVTKQTSDIIIKTSNEKVSKDGKSQDIICIESKKEVMTDEQVVKMSSAKSTDINQVKIGKRQIKKKSINVGTENMRGTTNTMSLPNNCDSAKVGPKSSNVPTSNAEFSVQGKSDSNKTLSEVRLENESSGDIEESGEEFLSCLENLESVVETVQLTDNCLS